jgi:ARG and Rhodanese-Phosphatase-superfamily-associated Protein domain
MEHLMHRRSLLALAALSLPLWVSSGSIVARADSAYRITGPVVHGNLAVYFVHGASSAGAVPLTLAEALDAKVVRVAETGSVNELAIENLGDREIFVQSGDIVKGGQQDRVLSVSLVLPPRSGSIPIAAFCVEQGRWSKRGAEDAGRFASASAAVPSRAAKLAIQPAPVVGLAAVPDRQHAVWEEAARIQRDLAEQLGGSVASPQSSTSLQLALENEKLKEAQRGYVAALQPAGEQDRDIIGYAFAINGQLSSADIYPSNGLFRKMWAKLLTANATEAIAAKRGAGAAAPARAAVAAFLDAAEGGTASTRALPHAVELEIHSADRALYLETKRRDGSWVHRGYVVK